MGLEKFNSDSENGGDLNRQDRDWKKYWEDVNQTVGLDGKIDGFDIVKDTHESDRHFNTKFNTALKLAKVGYNVALEKKVSTEHANVVPDIIVYETDKVVDENRVIDSSQFTVEVGQFYPQRAKAEVSRFGSVIWIEKGESISDGMVISELVIDRLNTYALEQEKYIDDKGDVVNPDIECLLTEKSREIAFEVLKYTSNFKDTSTAKATERVNDKRPQGYEYSEDDVKKVLLELGVISN